MTVGVITREYTVWCEVCEYTVWCGVCGQWFQHAVNTSTVMSQLARKMGWSKTKLHGWTCPDCLCRAKRADRAASR